MLLPNYTIDERGSITAMFKAKGVDSFGEAGAFVKSIPYGRNGNKDDVFAVFSDNCGTCSTKHALLKRLADELGLEEVELVTGIYKMNRANTPGIGDVLERNGLEYLPEAHNYLKLEQERFDFTFPYAKGNLFKEELLAETVIEPHQIGDYKVKLHKSFLEQWLLDNKAINLSPAALWEIREECIVALSQTTDSR